jgi:hypothetical protein
MSDLKLDTNGDLAIVGDTLVLTSGIEKVAQDLTIRLQFFQGEWFLDSRLGVPYFQKILGEKPRLNVLKNIFRKAIMTSPGVRTINDLILDYDGPTRRLSVSFNVKSVEGDFTYTKELIV